MRSTPRLFLVIFCVAFAAALMPEARAEVADGTLKLGFRSSPYAGYAGSYGHTITVMAKYTGDPVEAFLRVLYFDIWLQDSAGDNAFGSFPVRITGDPDTDLTVHSGSFVEKEFGMYGYDLLYIGLFGDETEGLPQASDWQDLVSFTIKYICPFASAGTYTIGFVNVGAYNSEDQDVSSTTTPGAFNVSRYYTAVGDSEDVPEDSQSFTIDVLGNDLDANGQTPGSEAVVVGVTPPTHGTAAFTDGNVSYTPTGNYNGSDFFVYTAIFEGDGYGGTTPIDIETVRVNVTALPDPPQLTPDHLTTQVYEDDTIQTVATKSDLTSNDTDPDIDYGDSVVVTSVSATSALGALITSGGGSDSIAYDPNGQFNHLRLDQQVVDTFLYQASDTQENLATSTVYITVNGEEDPPSGQSFPAGNPKIVPVGDPTTFTMTLSDPDQGDTPYVSTIGTDVSPDGTNALSFDVTKIVDDYWTGAQLTVDSGGIVQFKPNDATRGTEYSFAYTVADNYGGSTGETCHLRVTGYYNTQRYERSLIEDAESVFINPTLNDTDENGNPVTGATIESVGTPLNGLVSISPDKTSVIYTPFANYNGTDFFTYSASYTHPTQGTLIDGETVAVSITPTPDLPELHPDALTTPIGEDATTVTVGTVSDLTSNDTDPDIDYGDWLEVIGISPTSAGGALVSFNPETGAITYNTNGKFNYLPFGSTLPDTFTYTASDQQGHTDTETVTVFVAGDEDPPAGQSFPAGNPKLIPVGDPTTFTMDLSDPDQGDTPYVSTIGTDVSPIGTNTLAFAVTKTVDDYWTSAQLTVDSGGIVQFKPNDATRGTEYSFAYAVADNYEGSTGETCYVRLTGYYNAQRYERTLIEDDETVRLNPTLNDTDEKGNTVTGATIESVGTPLNGSVSISPDKTSVIYTPFANYNGTDFFTYSASYTHPTQGTLIDDDTVALSITPTPDPPELQPDALTTPIDEDATTATVGTVSDLLANDKEWDIPNGDWLSVTGISPTSAGGALVSFNPGTGIITYNTNGKFNYLPLNDSVPDTFTYTASDQQGHVDMETVTVFVAGGNDPPEGESFPVSAPKTIPWGMPVNFTVALSDPDRDEVPYISNAASGVQASPTGDNGLDFRTTNDPPQAGAESAEISVNSDGTAQFSPNQAPAGSTYRFIYTVADPHTSVDETVSLRVLKYFKATRNTKTFPEDMETVRLSPALDDTDENGNVVTGATIESVGTPLHGSVSLSPNKTSVTYRPNAHYNGTDFFTYSASYTHPTWGPLTDGETVTLLITPTPDPPELRPDTLTMPVDEDAGRTPVGTVNDLLANDTDPDFSNGDWLSVTGVSATSFNGALVSLEGDSIAYNPNGLFDYLRGNESLTDTFTYTVSDQQGNIDTSSASIVINGADDAPQLMPIPTQTSFQDRTFEPLNLTDSLVELEGEPINWTFSGNGELSVQIDEHGVASVTIPNETWVTPRTIRFTATDDTSQQLSAYTDVTFQRYAETILTFPRGWTQFSIPFPLNEASTEQLLAVATGPIWYWNGTSYVAIRQTTTERGQVGPEALLPGRAFWLYFGGPEASAEVELDGFRPVETTVALEENWNMAGAIGFGDWAPLPQANGSPFADGLIYFWNGDSYQMPVNDRLLSKQGYWIRKPEGSESPLTIELELTGQAENDDRRGSH